MIKTKQKHRIGIVVNDNKTSIIKLFSSPNSLYIQTAFEQQNTSESSLIALKNALSITPSDLFQSTPTVLVLPDNKFQTKSIPIPNTIPQKNHQSIIQNEFNNPSELAYNAIPINDIQSNTTTYIVTYIDLSQLTPYITLFEDNNINFKGILPPIIATKTLINKSLLLPKTSEKTLILEVTPPFMTQSIWQQHDLIFYRKTTININPLFFSETKEPSEDELSSLITSIQDTLTYLKNKKNSLPSTMAVLGNLQTKKTLSEHLSTTLNLPIHTPFTHPSTTIIHEQELTHTEYLPYDKPETLYALGAALHLTDPSPQTLITPAYKQTLRIQSLNRILTLCLIGGILLSGLIVSGLHLQRHLLTKKITLLTSQQTYNTTTFRQLKKKFNVQRNYSKSIQNIEKKLITPQPIEELVYELSKQKLEKLHLTQLTTNVNEVNLKGSVLTSEITTEFTKFISLLEHLNFTKNITYNTRILTNTDFSHFSITLYIKEENS